MNESIAYIESSDDIPMWTVFVVKRPIRMVLTVIPLKSNSVYANHEGAYRCLINGVGEEEKAAIRRLINLSLQEDDEEDTGE